MKRWHRKPGRGHLCVPAGAAALALTVTMIAGCGSSPTPPIPAGTTPTGSVAATLDPEATSSPPASEGTALVSASPAIPELPSTSPTAEASGSPGPASSCSGTPENRDFFATVAALVTWDVYCAVVPDGWYIESGKWRLKDGGRLDVTYSGPNGARLVLAEGVFCTDSAAACSPRDQLIGDASFGDRTGQLVSTGGGFAIYVDPGQQPAWQASATGLDQQTFASLADALVRVGQ